ncbi:MAG: delta-60 repeat domain-containing protein [Bacteroidetes bacterium]|nr:delta-60 repeat domain-containing protein [Bacteroidota bacterium]
MPRTLLQNEQTDLDFPLRMRATLPSPDAWLNFSPSSLPATGDGLSQSVTPLGSNLPSVPLTRVNFQTGATSGGTFSGLLPFPVTTVGDYRRVGFALLPNGQIKVKWSAQSATLVGLQNPGKLVSSGGLPIGWIDLQATSSTAYKTAGSATNIIENDVAGVSRINIFAPGAGGGGVFEQQIVNGQVVPADIEDLLLDENESKIAHVLYGITRVYEESVSGGPVVLDTAYLANSTDGSKFNAAVFGVNVQDDGKLVVGGDFTNYGGTTGRNKVVRLNIDGSVDSAFCVNASDGGKFNTFLSGSYLSKQTIVLLKQGANAGKILIVGSFVNYDSVVGRSYCVLLNSDGTTDTTFMSNIDGNFNLDVLGAVEQGDGKILLFGIFTDYAGVTGRNRLIRLNSDGTVDTSFCGNACDGGKLSTDVYEVRLFSDDTILVLGAFTDYDSILNQNYLIKLNSDGTLNSTFASNINNQFAGVPPIILPSAHAFIRSDDKILLSVIIGFIHGQSSYAVLNSDGSLDLATSNIIFPPARWNDYPTYHTIELPDGRLVFANHCTNIDGISGLDGFVIIDSAGNIELVDSDVIAGSSKISIFRNLAFAYRQSDNNLFIGSLNLTNYDSVSGRDHLLAFSFPSAVTLDDPFVSNSSDGAKFNAAVDGVYTQADGKVLVAGTFTNYDGVTGRNHLVRLNADGSVDSAFCVNASDGGKFNQFVDPFIATVPKQNVLELSSGKILVTGYFTNYNSVSGRSYCILLNADGTTDVSFTSAYLDGNFNNPVTGAIEQPDGKLLIFGFFTNFDGVTGRDCLVRLNADGTLDTSFCVNASDGSKFDTSGIYEVRLLSDSSIIVFGAFANYDGISGQDYLIKLNPDGTLNSTFATNINGQWAGILPVPKSMAFVRSDDKIFVSYLVNTLYGESLLAVVNPDGTFDAATTATFAPPGRFTTNGAYSILELPDGRLVWGSDSTDIDGVTGLNGFVIINADGSLDLSSSLAIAGLNLLPPISEHVFAYRPSDQLLLISSVSLTDYGGVVGRDYLVAFDLSGESTITERITQGEIAASYSYGAGGWAILDDNWVGDTPEVILSLSTSGQFQYTSSSLSGTEIDSKLRYQLRNL